MKPFAIFALVLLSLSSAVFAVEPLEPSPTDPIPASAIGLEPVEKAVIDNVYTDIVPLCPECEGGPEYTFVEVKFFYSTCNELLPVQQGVAITEDKVAIKLAAIEVVTAQSLRALCGTKEYVHTIKMLGKYDKAKIALEMLTVKK